MIILGHSYGGWLAMQTAALLLADRKLVTALLTIDPLSPLECDFKTFKGCQRAPQDIPQETLERVSREVGSWINYVSDVNTEGQKFFIRLKKGLHSSPIEQAIETFWSILIMDRSFTLIPSGLISPSYCKEYASLSRQNVGIYLQLFRHPR